MHKITIKEWKKLNERERIWIIMEQGVSYREAWELSDAKKPSDLPGELLPLVVEQFPPEVMETLEVTFKLKDFEKLEKIKGNMSWHDFISKMGMKCGN